MKIGNESGVNVIVQLNRELQEQRSVEAGTAATGSTSSIVAKADTAGENVNTMNPLAGNFVNKNFEQSRYIQGTLVGLQVQSEFGTRLQSLVDNYASQAAGGDSNNAERSLIGRKAARATEELVSDEVADTENARLEKDRQEYEDKIKEKTAQSASEPSGETVSADAPENTPETPAEADLAQRQETLSDQSSDDTEAVRPSVDIVV